ncbi:MAG: hypothetical protein JWO58_372 [Chitinophagaceae bacterium]|nr:hypothetical protein [Chitinophagaceae bacterium]
MMKTFTQLTGCFILIIFTQALLIAQPAMIKDINGGTQGSAPTNLGAYGTVPNNFLVVINSIGYFIADDGGFGSELWRTDGTTAGTYIVSDINPGINSSNPNQLVSVTNSTTSITTLYFAADDGVHGTELWQSDGTDAGTMLVKDINDSSNIGSNPSYIRSIGNYVVFVANDGLYGNELWRSDATGTFLIKDINATVISGDTTASSDPFDLVKVGTSFYFSANDGAIGKEVWKSDGTAIGTVNVFDVNPGAPGSSPQGFTLSGSSVYFTAYSPSIGAELWKTSVSSGSTAYVKDINIGTGSSAPVQLTNVNGYVYFVANDGTHGVELWRSNGSDVSTVLVADINPGTGNSSCLNFKNINNVLYFRANDGTHGAELWKSDNTSPAATPTASLVLDINSGAADSAPSTFLTSGTEIYFSADDGIHGTELWQTNGTALGTTIVADINTGSASSSPTYFYNLNSTMVFVADDGTHGMELWTLDGTTLTGTESGTETITKQVSPNPTQGAVRISNVKLTETLNLYNSIGDLLNTYTGAETVTVDLSTYNNGVYIVRSSEGGFLKIVKQ